MKFRAEFIADPERGTRIAQRAALAGDLVHVSTDRPNANAGHGRLTHVAVQYEAPDRYTARSLALVMQGVRVGADHGALPVEARVRRDAVIPGRWFYLNEDD